MKVKTVIIALTVTAALAAGGVYGAYHFAGSRNKPVRVVKVSSVNYGNWWGDYLSSTTSGEVISVDSQAVTLSTEYALKKVFVETGDTVKTGDPLLEYDMTLPELQKEMEDLNHQLLEIQLDSQQKSLAKLNGGTLPAAVLDTEEDQKRTGSADDLIEEGEVVSDSVPETTETPGSSESSTGSSNGSSDNQGQQTETPENSGNTGNDNTINENTVNENPETGDQETGTPETGTPETGTTETGTPETETPETGTPETGNPDQTDTDGDVIEDGTDNGGSETEQGSGDDDSLIDDELIEDDEELVSDNEEAPDETDQTTLLTAVENFLSNVSLLQQQELTDLKYDYISEGMDLFEKKLAVSSEVTYTNLLSEEDTVEIYTLSEEVKSLPGVEADTRAYLYQGYARTLLLNFIYYMNQLESLIPEGKTVADLTDAEVLALEVPVRNALKAYDKLRMNTNWTGTDENGNPREIEEGLGAFAERLKELYVSPYLTEDAALPNLIARLREKGVVTETEVETETEAVTEAPWDIGDPAFPDLGDYGEDSMTAEERAQAIQEQVAGIKETKLQMRESDLKLRQFERKLENQVVRAQMDGVVMSAGTIEGGGSDNGFIVIAGAAGLYVQGSLSELMLETIHVGDEINVSSWEYGYNCTATITEISGYPLEDNMYGGWGENGNASYYPFNAYIENTDGVQEGFVEITFQQTADTSGIYLEQYFVKTDASGKNYVFVRGKDGLLEKRYVKTAVSDGGYSVRIRSGLSEDDWIAFPGTYVEEGAKTVEAETIEESIDYYGQG